MELKPRKLIIVDPIDFKTIEKILQFFDVIKKDEKEIKSVLGENVDFGSNPVITLSSYGGSAYCMFGAYDIIKSVNCNTVAIATIQSAATIIFLAGKERICYPNTRFMIHDCSGFTWGKAQEMKETLEEMEILNSMAFDIICNTTKISRELLIDAKQKKKDLFFNATEALEYGIVTKIIR